MRQYSLAPYVHWCKTQDGIVLMDLRRATYLGIGGDQLLSLMPLVKEWSISFTGAERTPVTVSAECEASIKELLGAGLLTDGIPLSERVPSDTLSEPVEAVAPDHVFSVAHVTPAHVALLLSATLRAAYRLRFASLNSTIASVRRRKEQRMREDARSHEDLISLTNVFQRLRPLFFTSKEQCLFDSLVLVEFLALYSHFPTWVFGVRTQPFAAHSWVQQRELVLNDTPERIRLYVPILSV